MADTAVINASNETKRIDRLVSFVLSVMIKLNTKSKIQKLLKKSKRNFLT